MANRLPSSSILPRAVYENRAAVTARHPAGNFINPENVTRDTRVPFHPGAVRYYREIAIWPEGEG